MKYHVYGLFDPRSPSTLRYVGMSTQIPARLKKHVNRPNGQDMRLWINTLRHDGLTPSIVILSSHDDINTALATEAAEIKNREGLLNFATPSIGTYKALGSTRTTTVAPPQQPQMPAGIKPLAQVERDHILSVISACQDNKRLAAACLGIGRQTLYNKLRAYSAQWGLDARSSSRHCVSPPPHATPSHHATVTRAPAGLRPS